MNTILAFTKFSRELHATLVMFMKFKHFNWQSSGVGYQTPSNAHQTNARSYDCICNLGPHYYLESRKFEEGKRMPRQSDIDTPDKVADARGMRTNERKGCGWVEKAARHWLHRETYLPAGHLADQPSSFWFQSLAFLSPSAILSPPFPAPRFHVGLTAPLDRSVNFFAR